MIKGQRREFDIWFTAKDLFHIKGWPEEIQRVTQMQVNHKPSLEIFKEYMHEILDKYHELTKDERKILAYRLALTAGFHMNKSTDPRFGFGGQSYTGNQKWVPKGCGNKIQGFGHGDPHHAIGLSYRVYMETQLGIKRYFELDENGKRGYESSEEKLNGWEIIDWTQEREDGLKSIVAAMQKLAERMGLILLNPEKTISMLESGGIKLID